MIDLSDDSLHCFPLALELCPPPATVREVDHLEHLPLLPRLVHHLAADYVVHVIGGGLLLVNAPGAGLLLGVNLYFITRDTKMDVNFSSNLITNII